jgi:stage V sporulation protein SpoVS
MLDATDGETEGAIVAVRRAHDRRVEVQTIGTGASDGTTPIVSLVACVGEHTGSLPTQARSRIKNNHSFNYKIVLNLKSFKERYT